MSIIVLDTNVVSELLRAAPNPGVVAFVRRNPSSLAVTTVTIHEIAYGLALLAEGHRRTSLVQAFDTLVAALGSERVLPLTGSAARRSGHVRALRRKHGRPVEVSDAHIAGIALDLGLQLATRNVRDFEGMGLPLVNPWSD